MGCRRICKPAAREYVYTGGGVLVWLPDLTRWAQVVAAALQPGGIFLLFEEHPIASCLWVFNGQLQVDSDYFGRGRPELSSGWWHFQGGEEARESKFEFSWPPSRYRDRAGSGRSAY